ncbi:MAG: flagellar hook-basal body complex protein FliE [Butyricicoccus sp.]|nr:flagellar hook-basal body complex protein FliE [Butyricicoccus sp.]
MAAIGSIQPLWDTFPSASTAAQKTDNTGMPIFADVFQYAIDNVKQTDAEKNQAEYLLATGQLDNPATLSIASTKAQLSVELLVQLRNKALDAYSEITRMSI